jgi:hypothetical protein
VTAIDLHLASSRALIRPASTGTRGPGGLVYRGRRIEDLDRVGEPACVSGLGRNVHQEDLRAGLL